MRWVIGWAHDKLPHSPAKRHQSGLVHLESRAPDRETARY